MKRFLRILVSLRTTAVLMLLVVLFLLLNVAVPQTAVVGEETIHSMIETSRLNRFVLETLGLSHLSTSPLFFVVLALFFVNLVAVLVKRTGPTISRIKARPPTDDAAVKWTEGRKALTTPLPDGFSTKTATQTLRGYGYKPKRVADRMWWGVKHRTAPLGFLIFHISFFFLCAGGALIYYTRFVGGVRLVEGQTFDGYFRDILRQPPLGLPTPSPFSLIEVDPKFAGGEPVDLRATIRPSGDAGEMIAWVNHPAKWGSQSVLVLEAGIAPEFWLQDSEGFTLDRISIAAPTRSQETISLPLGEGAVEVRLRPVAPVDDFPTKGELPTTPIEVHVYRDDVEIYSGLLHEGESAVTDDYRLTLSGVRYWAGFLVIDERGGALLIIGFLLGVIGATWRLVTHRRELVIAWDGDTLRLAGKGEFFPERFSDELAQIRDTLTEQRADDATEQPTENT